MRYDTISFLSDYGLTDEFVGVVKSVMRSTNPEPTIIDVTHDIPAHNVRAGGLALARAAQYLCPGVVVAVVDPGVGTERRAIAVEIGDGAAVLLGPDNGLLAPAVSMVGGASRAVNLTNEAYHLPAPGPTFAGRDIFAPVAAHLCAGVDLAELGTLIEPAGLQPGILPLTSIEDGRLRCEVLWVDHFGNAQLNVDPDEVTEFSERITVTIDDTVRSARRVRTFAELSTGEIGLLVDSYGLLTVAMDRASAAGELRIGPGDELMLADDESGEENSGVITPVQLTRSPRGAGPT